MRDGSDNVLLQAYYGTQYIDEIVALKLQHGYCTVSRDANYNVTTLTDLAGRVLERVFYTEYGQPIIESESYFGDYDGDGDLDSTDIAQADTGGACRGSSPSGACRVLDTDQDGDVDGTDYTTLSGLINAAPTTNRVHHARRTSPVGNLFLHQGLVYDAEIGAYQNRAREFAVAIQRFAQPDPLEYSGGLNLYTYLTSSPTVHRDPSGKDISLNCNWTALGRCLMMAIRTMMPAGGFCYDACVTCAIIVGPENPACWWCIGCAIGGGGLLANCVGTNCNLTITPPPLRPVKCKYTRFEVHTGWGNSITGCTCYYSCENGKKWQQPGRLKYRRIPGRDCSFVPINDCGCDSEVTVGFP